MSDTILELKQIAKGFGSTDVLNGIDLSIRKGEFITLLGPSGCGKTTTLRIIAGLESPDSGRVFLNGTDVTELEPNKRDVNTVFQNYALFPHMDVAGNIGYGLKLRKVSREQIRETVSEALSLVQLTGYEKRYPSELSGGQRQRVAIARAIVNKPQVLLLDEPLGALDLQLRRQMQIELKRLQKKLGLTFIYITHDQEEAINMSDRIAVMKDGRFEQVGTPSEVYDTPKTSYVAKFVGSANVLSGTAAGMDGKSVVIRCEGGRVRAFAKGLTFREGTPLTFAVRSEKISLCPLEKEYGISADVFEKTFAGGMLRIALRLASGAEVIASRHGIDSGVEAGETVNVCFEAEDAVLVDLDSDVRQAENNSARENAIVRPANSQKKSDSTGRR